MNQDNMVVHYFALDFFHMEMEKQDALEGKRTHKAEALTSSPHIAASRSDTASISRSITVKDIHTTVSHQHRKRCLLGVVPK